MRVLRTSVEGTVLEASDDGYDAARAGWNPNVDQRPALIVRPAVTSDIARATLFASEHELGIGVQSTGHGAVVPCDGLLIDTSRMKAIRFASDGTVATVQPGATWAELDAAARIWDRTGNGAFDTSVGVVGSSLGGGIGWFSREFGYAADRIVGATVVLVDGTVVEAGAGDHMDLLWALRGGGGNFGVVASLRTRLLPIRRVFGGSLVFAIANAREVVRRFATWSTALPDAFTAAVWIGADDASTGDAGRPPREPIVRLGACFNGSAADGEALMAAWSDLEPLSCEVGELETTDLDRLAPEWPGRLRTYRDCAVLVELPDAAIDALAASFEARMPNLSIEIRAVGGAMNRPATESAVSDGDARFIVHVRATYEDVASRDDARGAVERVVRSLAPFATGLRSLGFLPDGDDARYADDAYDDATYLRLTLLKQRYDPDNFFNYNHNIEPYDV